MLSSTKEPAHCHFGAAETVVLALESVADGVSQIDGEKMWIDDRLGSKRSVAGRKDLLLLEPMPFQFFLSLSLFQLSHC